MSRPPAPSCRPAHTTSNPPPRKKGICRATYDPIELVASKLPAIKQAHATMMARQLHACLEVGIHAATEDAPTLEEPEPPELEEEAYVYAGQWLQKALELAAGWTAAGDGRDPEDPAVLYLRAVALERLDAVEQALGAGSAARANQARMAIATVLAKTGSEDMEALEREKTTPVPRGTVAVVWEDRVAEKRTQHARRASEAAVLKAAVERIETCIAEQPVSSGKKRAAPKGKKAAAPKGKKAKASAPAAAAAAAAEGDGDDGHVDDVEDDDADDEPGGYYGTKMAALASLLAEQFSAPSRSGKAVVFSSYPDMLKLAQRSLKAAGISSVCPKDLAREDRNKALLDFSTADSAVSVMLLALDPEWSSGLTRALHVAVRRPAPLTCLPPAPTSHGRRHSRASQPEPRRGHRAAGHRALPPHRPDAAGPRLSDDGGGHHRRGSGAAARRRGGRGPGRRAGDAPSRRAEGHPRRAVSELKRAGDAGRW